MSRKPICYRTTLVSAAIITCIMSATPVFAERVSPTVDEKTIENTLNTLTTEARAAHAARIFTDCFQLSYNEWSSSSWKGTRIADNSANWMVGSWTKGGTRGVGAWLEAKVSGEEAKDGAIYCDENDVNLLNVFATQIDETWDSLLCGEGGTPGLFREEDHTGKCDMSSKEQHEMNPEWKKFIGSKYNAYAESHNWKYRYGSGSNPVGSDFKYPDVIGYTMYVSEIATGCGKDAGSTKPASNFITTPLAYVNANGEVTDEWYYGSDSAYVVPETSNGEHHAFVSRAENATCSQMMAFANEKSGYFQAEVFSLIEEGCAAAYEEQYEEAKKNVEDENVSESKKETLNQAISEYETMKRTGKFTEATENGGLQCKETEYLATVKQGAWIDTEMDGTGADDEAENEPSCLDNAGALGWIICPSTNSLATLVENIYEDWVVPFLSIKPALFDGSVTSHSGTFEAWKEFAMIANILFAVFFLIVIFSQLTGFGINNYGIKKILPKLIIVAVLINASYIICQAAVDLSNILGNSLGELLKGMRADIADFTMAIEDKAVDTISGGDIAGTAIIGVGLIAILVTPTILSAGFSGFIIVVLLALLSILISILTLAITLSLRQALAVILVVISPLAFACYMLPNTESLYKKWFNMFKGILLAYPICSVVVHGCQLAASIILSSFITSGSNVGCWLVIMVTIISVAPFLFVPGIIKKSLGTIGAMVDGFSKRISHGAQAGARAGLMRSALGRRSMYHAKQRELKFGSKMGEYNAKRSAKTVDALMAKAQKNHGQLSATDSTRLRVASGMVDAQYRSNQEGYNILYGTQGLAGFGLSGDSVDSTGRIRNAAAFTQQFIAGKGKDARLDVAKATSAIERIATLDQGKATAAIQALSSSDEWKTMSSDDKSRMVTTLLSQKGNLALQSFGKLLGASADGGAPSFDDAVSSGDLASKIQSAGNNALIEQDKDALDFMQGQGLGDAWSSQQVANWAATGDTSSKAGQNALKMIQGRSEANREADAQTITSAQAANATAEALEAIASAGNTARGAIEAKVQEALSSENYRNQVRDSVKNRFGNATPTA